MSKYRPIALRSRRPQTEREFVIDVVMIRLATGVDTETAHRKDGTVDHARKLWAKLQEIPE